MKNLRLNPRPSRVAVLGLLAQLGLLQAAPTETIPTAGSNTPSSTATSETEPVVTLSRLLVVGEHSPQPIDDVPQTSMTFDRADLARQGVDSIGDLAPMVPGFTAIEQGAGCTILSFRGIISESTDPRQSPRAGVFFDGISTGRPATAALAWFDLQHIDVMKGPQDAALGRAASAGALVIESAKPTATPGGELTATFGENRRAEVSGHVNQPLTEDGKLSARVAFFRDTSDGYVDNLAGGEALQSRDTAAVRPSIAWRPSDETDVVFTLHYQRDKPSGAPFKSMVIPTSQGDTDPFSAAELNRGDELGFDREVFAASLRIEHEISPDWKFASATTGVSYDSHEEFDGDGSRIYLLELAEQQDGRELGQDFRLTRDLGERGRVHLGAHFHREDLSRDIRISTDEGQVWPFFAGRFRSALLAGGVPLGIVDAAAPVMSPFARQSNLPAGFAALGLLPSSSLASLAALANAPLNPDYAETYREEAETDSGELYVGGVYRPASKLELSASLRAIHEDQTFGYQAPASSPGSTLGFLLGASPNLSTTPTPGGALRSVDRSDLDWAARVGASYELTKSWQAFGSVARGRRPGTVVVGANAAADTELDPEEVVALETGLRWTSRDGRASAQAAVFHQDFSHFQTSQADPSNPARFIARDAGELNMVGAEFAGRLLLGDQWELFGSYGYIDAEFAAIGDDGQPQQFAGFTPRMTSAHTFALGTTFRQPIDGKGAIFVTPVAQYRSEYYFEDDNSLFGGTLRQGGFTVVNLRVGWISPARRWRVTAFADNLLDKAWRLDAGNLGASFGIPTVLRAAPRLAGIETGYAW